MAISPERRLPAHAAPVLSEAEGLWAGASLALSEVEGPGMARNNISGDRPAPEGRCKTDSSPDGHAQIPCLD